MRVADVQKAEIADIRQQGEEVSFRAPLEGNHGVSGVTTVMQAGSPEQAAAIAQALAARTEGSTPFMVNYGTIKPINPFDLTDNGRLIVGPDTVRITGRRIGATLSLAAGIGRLVLLFGPFLIAFVLTWRALHDVYFALFVSSPIILITSIIFSLPSSVSIPRRDITGVERDGRQLILQVQIAGQEEQAVFHTRTEEEAAAAGEALGE